MSERRKRLLFFLYGTPNIVGAALGLLGLLLFFTGVIRDYWFFIVMGLYAVGWTLTPKNRPVDLRLKDQLDLGEIKRELEGLVATIRPRVPQQILDKVLSIQATLLELLPTVARADAQGGYDTHVVRQTALTYLPETLENYLKLPPAFARFHAVKEGKTAQQLLSEQLELLDGTLKEVAANIYRNDTDRLLINGRFLEETFRKGELAL